MKICTTILICFCISLISFNIHAQADSSRITSLTTNDEDPWLMKALDGNYYIAYFSDSLGTPDVWITKSSDGIHWDPAWVAMETPTENEFYPCMAQAADSSFHMAWMKQETNGSWNIWYSHSSDAIVWSSPIALTTDVVSINWLPNLLIDYNGTFHITWSSNKTGNMELYSIKSSNGGATWTSPVQIINHPFHDLAPFVLQKYDSSYVMVWQHFHDTLISYLSDSTEIFYSTSADGENWSTPSNLTLDPTNAKRVDALPIIYADSPNNDYYISWTSTRHTIYGGTAQLSLSAIENGANGSNSIQIPGIGYSPRIISTGTAGKFLMIWVSDPNGDEKRDIYHQFITLSSDGIENKEANSSASLIKVFPNPFTDEATLVIDQNMILDNYHLNITNLLGQEIKSVQKIHEREVKIRKEDLPNGIYLYSLKDVTNKIIGRGKLIIQ